MTTQKLIEPYDITNGEKVTYGYFTVLDIVFSRYISELESLFFDQFRQTLEFEFHVHSDKKFKKYINTFIDPTPVFVFETSPLIGNCLLKLDNKSANFVLNPPGSQKESLSKSDQFTLNSENFRSLQLFIEKALKRYYTCWNRFFDATGKLKKLVSNKIKAKIFEPQDACVVVELHIKGGNLDFHWEFCFSAYHLDQIIKNYGPKVLLAGSSDQKDIEQNSLRFETFLMEGAKYDLQGVLGSLTVSEKELIEHFNKQSIIPIKIDIKDNVIININEAPVLAATAGVTHENISLRVTEKYHSAHVEYKTQDKPFKVLSFPQK